MSSSRKKKNKKKREILITKKNLLSGRERRRQLTPWGQEGGKGGKAAEMRRIFLNKSVDTRSLGS